MTVGTKTMIAIVFSREGPGELYVGARAEEAIKKFIGQTTVTVFEIDAVYGLEELMPLQCNRGRDRAERQIPKL